MSEAMCETELIAVWLVKGSPFTGHYLDGARPEQEVQSVWLPCIDVGRTEASSCIRYSGVRGVAAKYRGSKLRIPALVLTMS
jgi:hypothetical protein